MSETSRDTAASPGAHHTWTQPPQQQVEQTSVTRNLLARLDIAIIDLEAEQRAALDAARESERHAVRVGEIKADLMRIRDELRPMLDISAPHDFPYDTRRTQ